jgi:hypothetical protein
MNVHMKYIYVTKRIYWGFELCVCVPFKYIYQLRAKEGEIASAGGVGGAGGNWVGGWSFSFFLKCYVKEIGSLHIAYRYTCSLSLLLLLTLKSYFFKTPSTTDN